MKREILSLVYNRREVEYQQTRQEALQRAKKIIGEYQMFKHLGFQNPHSQELFRMYMAGYLLQKTGYDESFRQRFPVIPFMGGYADIEIIPKEVEKHVINEEVSQDLIGHAKIRENSINTARSSYAQLADAKRKSVEVWAVSFNKLAKVNPAVLPVPTDPVTIDKLTQRNIDHYHPEAKNLLADKETSLSKVRYAANLVSSAYFKTRDDTEGNRNMEIKTAMAIANDNYRSR